MPTTLGQLFVTFGRIAELDTTLLRQFVQTTDEDAFAELVARHGPMVLAVCRRVLRDRHLAEDAFQAVFIVLARRAAQMNVDRPLGPWLYGVAYRTALGALAMRKKQLQREQTALLRSTSEPDDATAVLDEEIAKLSENYRDAIILCELQGVSRSEAAKRLGIPAGTLSSRLATARKTLANRLRQRGVLLGTTLTSTALLSKELLATTVATSTGKLILSAQLLQLVHGATQMAFLSKLKLMTVAVVVCLLIAGGFGLWRVSESKAAPLSNIAKNSLPESRNISAPLPKAKPPEGVIVLSSFGEKKKIELFKPDGESLKVFEPKGSVVNARLSSDGKRIAYFERIPKVGALKGWVDFNFCWFDAEADGLEVQKIAENVAGGVSYAWSVDGQTVFFSQLDPEKYEESAKRGELLQYRSYAFNFKTKKATELKLPAEQMILDIAPDGKSLLTSSQFNGAPTCSLSLTPLDTCKPQLLVKDETVSSNRRFAPDGKQLLLSRVGFVALADKDKGPGVYLLDLATKIERKIRLPDEVKDSQPPFNACFSPDGKRIAIHWNADIPEPPGAFIPVGPAPAGKPRWTASRVTVCDIDGGNAKTIIRKEYKESITGIDWAPVRLPEEVEKADRNINAPLPKQVNRESVLLLSSFNKDKPLEVIKPDGKAVKTIKSEEWFKPLQVELWKDGKRAIFQNMAPIVARKVPFTMQSLGWMDLTTETPEPKWIAQELYYITKAMSADGGTVFYSHIDLEKLGNGPTKGESLPFESWQYDIAKDKKTRLDLPSEHAVIGITPDGKNLLTSTTNHGSYKHSLSLTPLDTMKPVAIREKPFSSVYSPRFSPDGNQLLWICIAEEKAEEVEAGVVITDLKSKKDSNVSLPKDTCVMHVCWSPDSQQIGFVIQQIEKKGNGPATLSEQRVAVCDSNGSNFNVIQKRAPGDEVMGLDWGIANSAAENKPSREPINAPLPKPKFEWKEAKGIMEDGKRITGVAASPDGKTIAVAQHGFVVLLEAGTRKLLFDWGHTEPGTITSVAFSPKGDKLAITRKDAIDIVDTSTGKRTESWEVKGFDPHQVILFTGKDGREHLVATNGEVTDRPDGSEFKGWAENRHKPCVLAAIPAKGSWMMAGHNSGKDADKTDIFIWAPADIENRTRLVGLKAWPTAAVVSADGKRIISADEGGTLILWESEKDEFKETSRIELGEGVAQLALAPDGKTVAAVRAYSDTTLMGTSGRKLTNLELHLFDVTEPPAKPNPLWTHRNLIGFRKADGPFSLSFSPDSKKLLAAFADPYISDKDAKSMGIKVWELKPKQ